MKQLHKCVFFPVDHVKDKQSVDASADCLHFSSQVAFNGVSSCFCTGEIYNTSEMTCVVFVLVVFLDIRHNRISRIILITFYFHLRIQWIVNVFLQNRLNELSMKFNKKIFWRLLRLIFAWNDMAYAIVRENKNV